MKRVIVETLQWRKPGDLFPLRFSVRLDAEILEFSAIESERDRRPKTWTTNTDGQIYEIKSSNENQKSYRLSSSADSFGVATLILNQNETLSSTNENFQLVRMLKPS